MLDLLKYPSTMQLKPSSVVSLLALASKLLKSSAEDFFLRLNFPLLPSGASEVASSTARLSATALPPVNAVETVQGLLILPYLEERLPIPMNGPMVEVQRKI